MSAQPATEQLNGQLPVATERIPRAEKNISRQTTNSPSLRFPHCAFTSYSDALTVSVIDNLCIRGQTDMSINYSPVSIKLVTNAMLIG